MRAMAIAIVLPLPQLVVEQVDVVADAAKRNPLLSN
jgi:hypothetical protein